MKKTKTLNIKSFLLLLLFYYMYRAGVVKSMAMDWPNVVIDL